MLTLSDNRLDDHIDELMASAALLRENNRFFIGAKHKKDISVKSAILIALNWQAISKTFLFTTIKGLGKFSDTLNESSDISEAKLKTLQTAVSVIADDLNNMSDIFRKKAPKGIAGIHYRWLEAAIITPLYELDDCGEKPNYKLGGKVTNLLNEMKRITDNPMGFAVQLRIVESIALDISLAFHFIFSALEHEGKKIFADRHALDWTRVHIAAEVIHNKQVRDEDYGMACIADTPEEQAQIVSMVEPYIALWAGALEDFADIIGV